MKTILPPSVEEVAGDPQKVDFLADLSIFLCWSPEFDIAKQGVDSKKWNSDTPKRKAAFDAFIFHGDATRDLGAVYDTTIMAWQLVSDALMAQHLRSEISEQVYRILVQPLELVTTEWDVWRDAGNQNLLFEELDNRVSLTEATEVVRLLL